MKKILILLFFTYFSSGYAQNIGDFRSRNWTVNSGAVGLWTDYRSWQIYNGSNWVDAVLNQYPGQTGYQGRNVTIQCIANAPVRIDKGTYAIGGSLTVEGTLEILNNNGTVEFTHNIPVNSTNSNPIQVKIPGGRILWAGNGNLKFPANSSIAITNTTVCTTNSYGLIGDKSCSASQLLLIGSIRYSSCNGGGGVVAGSFEEINDAGGSLIASPYADPIAVCTDSNNPITLLGYIFGDTTTLGKVTYTWTYVSGPVSTVAIPNSNTQSPNIGLLTVPGNYVFQLEILAKSVSDRKEITVSVDGTTTFNGTSWSHDVPSLQNHRHAVISSPYVTADKGAFSACSCTVNAGQKLTVSGGTTVDLVGKLTNNGTAENVVIESDGNLIQKLNVSNTGAITVQRYVTDMDNVLTGPGSQMDYVFWSSPVVGQNLQAFSPGTQSNRIYQYNEANDLFTQASGDFAPGKGYAIQAETMAGYPPNTTGYNKTYEFKGVPHNGDIPPVTIKKSPNSGAVEHGYNLLGNPYPSNISFDELYNLNASSIKPTVWFWTNKIYTPNQQGSSYDGSNYVAYTKGGSNNPGVNGIIKVGQGFIVQKTALGDGTFTFKNMNGTAPVRVADAGTFYQRGTMNRYWLALTSPDEMINTQLIGYFDGAADGYDGIYDAKALAITPDLFYSVVDDQRLLVQGKAPVFRPEDRVALGANLYREGNYTITLQQPEGIFAGRQAVYVKDHETGRMTNLSEQPYTFAAKSGMSEGRFEVFYQPQAKPVASESAKDGVVVYRNGTLYIIKSREDISLIEVYDGAGRMVHTEHPGREEVSIITEHYPKGVFFLKIHTGGSVITKKVLH